MSEAKSSKKAAKPKAETAPKAKAESKSADTKTKAKDDAGSASSASPSTEAKSSDGAKDAGKSARESAGGKADAHYGYFSSVRTPEYRSGWDSIWGSKNGDDAENGEEAPRQPGATRATS